MEKNRHIFPLLLSIVVVLGLISFALCIASEFKKSKEKDVRVEGKLCYLPESGAFRLGLAAAACFSVAHIVGNLLVCYKLTMKMEGYRKTNKKKIKTSIFSLILSWVSFGVATILIGVSTSMSSKQALGEGWLDGDCYLVKDGVYFGSAFLVLFTLAWTIASSIILPSH